MNRVRVIPVLLLDKGGLYKTVNFKAPFYIGDPANTVKIFNEKEVDELILLDYRASIENRRPDFLKIAQIAEEAFMPMAYGGGIKSFDDAQRVFDCGFEKVIVNSALFNELSLIEKVSATYGSQAVVAVVDYKKTLIGGVKTYSDSGTKKNAASPLQWAKTLEAAGAGEILLHSIDREGTWGGYDLPTITEVSQAVKIPVVACGGATGIGDFKTAVKAGASAVAASSVFVYQKKGMGVLVSFVTEEQIQEISNQ